MQSAGTLIRPSRETLVRQLSFPIPRSKDPVLRTVQDERLGIQYVELESPPSGGTLQLIVELFRPIGDTTIVAVLGSLRYQLDVSPSAKTLSRQFNPHLLGDAKEISLIIEVPGQA